MNTPATKERKQWTPTWERHTRGRWPGESQAFICEHCGLIQREHINSIYCPEWRLRQLDGDR